MAETAAQIPPRYLRTQEAARFLGLSERTLEKHRTYGTGPTYRKLGGRVVYGLDDLQAWADRGTVTEPVSIVPFVNRHTCIIPAPGAFFNARQFGVPVNSVRAYS